MCLLFFPRSYRSCHDASHDPDVHQDQHAHHSQKLQAPVTCVRVRGRDFLDRYGSILIIAKLAYEQPDILNHLVPCSWFAVHLGLDIWHMVWLVHSSDRTKTPSFPGSRTTFVGKCWATLEFDEKSHPPNLEHPLNHGLVWDLYNFVVIWAAFYIRGYGDEIWAQLAWSTTTRVVLWLYVGDGKSLASTGKSSSTCAMVRQGLMFCFRGRIKSGVHVGCCGAWNWPIQAALPKI